MPVQGGLAGKASAEPRPGGRGHLWEKGGVGAMALAADLAFQTDTPPSSSDPKARLLIYPRSGS